MAEEEMEPGHYVATRDEATGQWSVVGRCGHCRERLTNYENPVVISPDWLSFDEKGGPLDYRAVVAREPDSGIFHAKCAQIKYRDRPERLPAHLRPRTVLVWPDPDGVVRYERGPHDRY